MTGPLSARVSVITTYRDAASFLAPALASLGRQTYENWRLLLCDDGSTDASNRIARDAARMDDRIHLLTSNGAGRRQALALCHAHVNTEFLGWLDADDLLDPRALEKTLRTLVARPSAGLVFTDRHYIDHQGRPLNRTRRASLLAEDLLVDFAPFHFRLLRNQVVQDAGGIRSGLEVGIDYDLVLRMSERAPVVHLAERLYSYRIHRQQISSIRHEEQRRASARAVRDALGRRGLDRDVQLRVDERTGRFHTQVAPFPKPRSSLMSLARGAAQRVRPHASPRRALRRMQFWPDRRVGLIELGLREGAHRVGLPIVPGPVNAARLIRMAAGGVDADLVFLHDVEFWMTAERPGEREAAVEILRAALARARGDGARVVWAAWDDAATSGYSESGKAVAAWCHLILSSEAHGRRWPLGHFMELLPVITRDGARSALGWDGDDAWVVCLGSPRSRESIITFARTIDASIAVAASAHDQPCLRVGGPRLHAIPWPNDRYVLAQLIQASDVIVLPEDAAPSLEMACRSLGRNPIRLTATGRPSTPDGEPVAFPDSGQLEHALDRGSALREILGGAEVVDWATVVREVLEATHPE